MKGLWKSFKNQFNLNPQQEDALLNKVFDGLSIFFLVMRACNFPFEENREFIYDPTNIAIVYAVTTGMAFTTQMCARRAVDLVDHVIDRCSSQDSSTAHAPTHAPAPASLSVPPLPEDQIAAIRNVEEGVDAPGP